MEESNLYANKFFEFFDEKKPEVFAPELLKIEALNVVITTNKRSAKTQKSFEIYLEKIYGLPFKFESSFDIFTCFNLSKKYNLTSYDAIYLELALRKKSKLATLDKSLILAAKDLDIYYD